MASFNRVILLGNLTRDPQLKYLPSQTAVVDFGMACNRKFKTQTGEDREEVMFIDCSAFGKQAEIINQYCQKGAMLLIEGRLKLDSWEDKQGGGKRHKHQIVIENFQLMPRRDGGGAPPRGDDDAAQAPRASRAPARPAPPRQPAQAPNQTQPAQPQPEQPYGEEQQFKEDDIPF